MCLPVLKLLFIIYNFYWVKTELLSTGHAREEVSSTLIKFVDKNAGLHQFNLIF